jgi:predicted AAA+ superfamily ATPase
MNSDDNELGLEDDEFWAQPRWKQVEYIERLMRELEQKGVVRDTGLRRDGKTVYTLAKKQ